MIRKYIKVIFASEKKPNTNWQVVVHWVFVVFEFDKYILKCGYLGPTGLV